MRGRLISRKPLLFAILFADLALLCYGVLNSPAPPAASLAVERPETGLVVLTDPPSTDEDALRAGSLLIDVGPGGMPQRTSEIDVGVRAVTEFLGRLYAFDERGLNRLDEGADPKTDRATVAGLLPYPGTFRPEDAAAGRRRLLLVGFDVAGVPQCVEYDGVLLTAFEMPRPPSFNVLGGDNGPARIAIGSIGDDRFVLALADGKQVFLGRFDGAPRPGTKIAWSAPRAAKGAERPHLVADASGTRLAVEIERDGASRAIAIFTADCSGDLPILEETRTIALGAGERLAGELPSLALESREPSLLLTKPDAGLGNPSSRVVSLADGEEEISVALAAWNLRTSRFEYPLLIHLAIYMVLGLLSRRRGEPEPRVVIYRPAPYLRRGLAFAIDSAVALLVAFTIVGYAFENPERALLERIQPGFEPLNGIALLIVPELFFVSLLVFMASTAIPEGLFSRSLGKRICGLQVVSLDGDPPSVGSTLTRSAMLYVEFVPPMIGVACAVFTKRRQRLGDLFGGTVVVDSASLRVRPATRQEIEIHQP